MHIKLENPYEMVENNVADSIIKFYFQINQLKNIYRQGWIQFKGEGFKEKCESVADHCFGVAMLALAVINEHNLSLNVEQVLKLTLVHELGEIYAGDITPRDGVSLEEKHEMEKASVHKVLDNISWGDEYIKLWEEYEESKTAESQFVKEIDKLEFIFQSACYGYDVSIFKKSISQINDEKLIKLVDALKIITIGNDKK